MKGYRTIIVGLLMAVVPTALGYLSTVHWQDYVSPNVALGIAGVLTVAMRMVTNTPPGQA